MLGSSGSTTHSMRALLHGAAQTAAAAAATISIADGDGDGAHEHPPVRQLGSLELRLIALFAILAAGLLGGLAPLAARRLRSADSRMARVTRAFGGGVILALALIHILPEGIEMLKALTPFPLGACFAILGALTLLAIEHAVTAALAPAHFKAQLRAAVRLASAAPVGLGGCGENDLAAGAEAGAGKKGGFAPAGRDLAGDDDAAFVVTDTAAPAATSAAAACSDDGLSVAAAAVAAHAAAAAAAAAAKEHLAHAAEPDLAGCRSCASVTAGGAGAVSHPHALAHSHFHTPDMAVTGLRQLVACYSLEAGCVFHSLVIGLGMGAAVDAAAVAALPAVTVAMVFHQALEGLALGAVLAPARFLPMWKRCVMIVAYALTMPAGIAAGIALAASFDPGSVTAQGVQGALSTFSAGLLLHLSLFQLIGEELTRHDLLVRPRLAAALFAAIAVGAASMAVIALWE